MLEDDGFDARALTCVPITAWHVIAALHEFEPCRGAVHASSMCHAGDFIEDDNGEYGQDLGEEEDWNRSEGSDAEREALPEKQSKKKKTGSCLKPPSVTPGWNVISFENLARFCRSLCMSKLVSALTSPRNQIAPLCRRQGRR